MTVSIPVYINHILYDNVLVHLTHQSSTGRLLDYFQIFYFLNNIVVMNSPM